MEGEEYGKNLNWVEHPVSNAVFCLHGQEKHPEPYGSFTHAFTSSLFIHVLGAAGCLAHPSLFSICVEALR